MMKTRKNGLTIYLTSLVICTVMFLFQACSDDDCDDPQLCVQSEKSQLSGTVLDGPLNNAFIRFMNSDNDIIVTGESNQSGIYEVLFPESTAFPIHIEVTGGIDFVTKETNALTLFSIALNDYQEIANITPLTHLAYLTAKANAGNDKITQDMLENATKTVIKYFGFRHSTDTDPFQTKIFDDYSTDALISSQLLMELIKRLAGYNPQDQELICIIWAEDLADDILNGKKFNNDIDELLSNGTNAVEICMQTHLLRIVLSCEMICHDIIVSKSDETIISSNVVNEKFINALILMGININDAKSQLSEIKIFPDFMVELRRSMDMIKKFNNDHLPTNFQTFNDALDDIQAGNNINSLTGNFASSLKNEATSISNAISTSETNILSAIIDNPLEEIKVVYPYGSIQENSTFKLLVSGKYKDGTTRDLSNEVSWEISKPIVLMDSKNLFIAAMSGKVIITAALDNVKDNITLEIVPEHPFVIHHEPIVNEYDVPFDQLIKVVFSKDIACYSVTTQAFVIESQTKEITNFTMNCADNQIDLSPTTKLDENMTYTVTVTTQLRDIYGNPLQTDYKWSFDSIKVPPYITSKQPDHGLTKVSLNSAIMVVFSEQVQKSTVTNESFTVSAYSKNISGTVNCNDGYTAVFMPKKELDVNTRYTVTITNDIKDLAGNSMIQNENWYFETERGEPRVISHIPESNQLDVSIPDSITVTFSEPIEITENCMILESNAMLITGTIVCKNSYTSVICTSGTFIFTPSIQLEGNSKYTATINSESTKYSPIINPDKIQILDLTNVLMPDPYTFTFETEILPEIYTQSSFLNTGESVSLNTLQEEGIYFTFSEPMALTSYSMTLRDSNQSYTLTLQSNNSINYTLSFDYKENTSYTLTTQSELKDRNGHLLSDNFLWFFQTKGIPPTIIKTIPENDAKDVEYKDIKEIEIFFSEPIQKSKLKALYSTTQKEPIEITMVNVIGSKFSYTITEQLIEDKQYTLTILADDVYDLNDNHMENTYTWSFLTKNEPPEVTDYFPKHNNTVATNIIVKITCNEAVTLLPDHSFTVKDSSNNDLVEGNLTAIGNVVYFTPLNLLPNKTYMVSTGNNFVQDLSSKPMSQTSGWVFTTIAASPVVGDFNYNNSVENPNISVSFSTPMNLSSFTADSFFLSSDKETVQSTIDKIDNKTISLTPITSLSYNTEYTLTVTSGVKDLEGHSFEGEKFHFTTIKDPLSVVKVQIEQMDYNETSSPEVTVSILFSNSISSLPYRSIYIKKEDGHIFYAPEPFEFNKEKVRIHFILDETANNYELVITKDVVSTDNQSLKEITIWPLNLSYKNEEGMSFAYIPKGNFIMGSPIDEPGRDIDENQNTVSITKSFMMQTTEVTQGQWKKIMNENPSLNNTDDNLPVENVSWNDVQKFIQLLNKKEGKNIYKLPTEAQWEYAARAKTQSAFSNGGSITNIQYPCEQTPILNTIAWYCHNSTSMTHIVKQKQSNAFNLYDMHGNVMEWTADFYLDHYQNDNSNDPTGPKSGSLRVYRGGSFADPAHGCRSGNRGSALPDSHLPNLGFRLIRLIP